MKLISIILALGVWAAPGQSPTSAVKDAPFSADQMQKGPYSPAPYLIGHYYRDSLGRTRTEVELVTGDWSIAIVDPVNGTVYSLDAVHKVAHRITAGTEGLGLPPDVIEQLARPATITTGNGYSSWLVNVRHDEPDAALFRVPAGYKVVNEN